MSRPALTRAIAPLRLRLLPARTLPPIRLYNSDSSNNGNNPNRYGNQDGGHGYTSQQGQYGQQSQYPAQQGRMPGNAQERDTLPGVNEEQAGMRGFIGGGEPGVEEVGTPVGEVINRDPAGREHAPEVLKQDPNAPATHHLKKTRAPEHTPTRHEPHIVSHILHETLGYPTSFVPTYTAQVPDPHMPISTYPLPPVPIPGTNRLRSRYPEIIDIVTNLIMVHGKKATAQKNMSTILRILQTKPAPRANDKYPLISGHPPLPSLPLNPIQYLQTAIDSVAPLMKIRNLKGAGGFANQLPVPLNLRQRRRTAVQWMLQSVEKKAGGFLRFPERFAEEVVAVVEGRSAAWERRTAVHKLSVASRANVRE